MSDENERSVASAGSAPGIPSIGQKVYLGAFVWEAAGRPGRLGGSKAASVLALLDNAEHHARPDRSERT